VRDINRYAGDIVAMVVADTQTHANDAVELIDASFEPLPAVTDVYAAMADGAPQLYDCYKNNRVFDWHAGNHAAADAAFEQAEQNGWQRVDIDVVNNRVVINSIETRPMLAGPGDAPDSLEIWCGTQGPVGLAEQIAAALSLPQDKVRVRTTDVGGSFGFKIFLHPEQLCLAWAARRLGALVRWQQNRSEAFVADLHGRDNRSQASAMIDENGRIHALKVTAHANMGAWLSNFSTYIPTMSGCRTLTTVYDIPATSLRVIGVVTNTPAVDAYRGAGRPEANYLMERLMDHIAIFTGKSRLAIRKTNMITAAQIPYTMPVGGSIDSGDMLALLDVATKKADLAGFAARRRDSQSRGQLRGIGYGMYLEQCGGGTDSGVCIEFSADGQIVLHAAQQCNGQGHRTTLTQILSDRLSYDADKITVLQGDSARGLRGTTGGARMTTILGSATAEAAAKIIAAARPYAAAYLEASDEAVQFSDGLFVASHTNRTIDLDSLVEQLAVHGQPHVLNMAHSYETAGATYPYGCHIAEVEIDPASCDITIAKFTVVDDFGLVINPMMLAGQIHGGIAQGVGQALYEHVVYDVSGQILSGSFMDYTMPRADHFPQLDIHMHNTPCQNNILGIKGSGEAGAIGAPQAVVSAVCDALGIQHVDMPVTPLKIFNILHQN
ncbi:MAG: molybdopterin-dependent oxidoreductase, partial [Alphaproteobacteria bacterium]|nr:molybdopterin-dependent oxidoreductase [Alphaproteobacteria bacterium]